jgi:hypothetical protein
MVATTILPLLLLLLLQLLLLLLLLLEVGPTPCHAPATSRSSLLPGFCCSCVG